MQQLIYHILGLISPLFIGDNKLRVLAYHQVPDKTKFQNQILYLKSQYNLIGIGQLRAFLLEGQGLPENPLLITFDDGDYSLYQNAFPVLKKYNLPAVNFIISELINSENTFWCRWVELIYEKEGKSYADARKEVGRLKKISNKDRVKVLNNLPAVYSKQLSDKDLNEMEVFNITTGNHTHTHPMIDRCTKQEIIKEMEEVRKLFDQWELKGYPYFAYPNGNFDSRSEEVLISKGIEIAFLFDHNLNNDVQKINPMRISRIRVNADADLPEFKVKVSGLHTKLMKLRNKVKA